MRKTLIVSAAAAFFLIGESAFGLTTDSAIARRSASATMPADVQPEVTPTGQSTGPTADSDRLAIGHAEQVVSISTNLDEVMSIYDANATLENLSPGVSYGTEDIRRNLNLFFSAYPDFKAHIQKIDITSDGYLAYAWSVQRCVAKGINGAHDIDVTFRQTDLYKKVNGQWLIVYQHLSVPVELSTGKAVFGR